MPSVGVGQQHGVWEMLAQHVGIADRNHIVEDAIDDQARLHDFAELGKALATGLFPSSKNMPIVASGKVTVYHCCVSSTSPGLWTIGTPPSPIRLL